MKKFIIIFLIIIIILISIIFLNNDNLVNSKLTNNQCKKWKELNKLIKENKEFMNKQDKVMLKSLFKKYCTKESLSIEPLIEPMEGVDCQIVEKIFNDILKRDLILNTEHHNRNKNKKLKYELYDYLHSICPNNKIIQNI